MITAELIDDEHRLVDQCVRGDAHAWETLYRRYQPILVAVGRALSGRLDGFSVEELAQEVWLALIERGGQRLRAFDSRRGNFRSYLFALARQQAQLIWRRNACRERHKVSLGQYQPADQSGSATDANVLLEEFRATLTPQEVRLYDSYVSGPSGGSAWLPLSRANLRKLKQRLMRRWHSFWDAD